MGAIADKISELENAIENELSLQDLLMDQHSELAVRRGTEFIVISDLEDELSDLHFWEYSKKSALRQRIEESENQVEILISNLEELENKIDESKSRFQQFQNDLAQTLTLLDEVGEDPDENGEISLDDDTIQRLDALFSEDD